MVLLRQRRILVVFAVLSLVGGIFFFRQRIAGRPTEPTVTVKKQNLANTLSLSGKVVANRDITLTFQTGGQLAWVGVKVGDRVKKNQAVASLDQRQLQKQLSKYLNTYLGARWNYDQAGQITYKDQVVTPAIKQALDQLQFTMNNTVSDVEIQSIAIQFANLYSPIDGIVTKVDVPAPGVNVTALTTGFEIVDPASIYFSASADQTDVVKLATGQSAKITFDSYPGETIDSAIMDIAFTPKAGETGTVYEVKMATPGDNNSYKYRLGMTGDVEFLTDQRENVLVVPARAVQALGEERFVYRQTNGQKTKTIVTTGLETDTLVEITSGLSEGDVVYD